MRRPDRIAEFADTLWDWFAVHKRSLPWRDLAIDDDTERAYRVLVSEIMLQQTQVPRVIIVFKRFLDRFPSMQHLARASNRDVIMAWQGMGYNSRALRLRDAAQTVVKNYNSVFPREMDQLLAIKGIGRYTAGAVRNFAFGLPTPCIDTNIRRILHRTFIGPERPDGTWENTDKELIDLARNVLAVALERAPAGKTTAGWHAALMDFGSLVQTKSNPKWHICPLTARGLMKTTPDQFASIQRNSKNQALPARQEPGRQVAGKFIPNRIFRGRIVEELRMAHGGLTLDQLGARITVDWSPEEHREWLSRLLEKLKKDTLITKRGKQFILDSR